MDRASPNIGQSLRIKWVSSRSKSSSRAAAAAALEVQSADVPVDDTSGEFGRCVWSDNSEWPTLVRAGLAAASGEHLVVLDINRHYSSDVR